MHLILLNNTFRINQKILIHYRKHYIIIFLIFLNILRILYIRNPHEKLILIFQTRQILAQISYQNLLNKRLSKLIILNNRVIQVIPITHHTIPRPPYIKLQRQIALIQKHIRILYHDKSILIFHLNLILYQNLKF